MTTRRRFIAGLMASAVAPRIARADPATFEITEVSLGYAIERELLVMVPGRIFAITGQRFVQWSADTNPTDWSAP